MGESQSLNKRAYKRRSASVIFFKICRASLTRRIPSPCSALQVEWRLDNHLDLCACLQIHVLTNRPAISPLQSCRTTNEDPSQAPHNLALRQLQVHLVDHPSSLAKTPRLALHLQKRILCENGSPT